MAKTWVLDTDTKGTGAQVRPLEDAAEGPRERRRPVRKPAAAPAREARPRKTQVRTRHTATPLAPGQVRSKTTGEIGKVLSVDPKAGTAVVRWLRRGDSSTVRLSAITRRQVAPQRD